MSDNNQRERGFYWVLLCESGGWVIAQYSFSGYWMFAGDSEKFYDEDLYEINEELIPLRLKKWSL